MRELQSQYDHNQKAVEHIKPIPVEIPEGAKYAIYRDTEIQPKPDPDKGLDYNYS